MQTQTKLLYDVHDAAKLLSISHWTVRRMLLNGTLRPTKLGRRLLVHHRDLERFAQKKQKLTNLTTGARDEQARPR
jgi:excisionase family DNA binding protein